MDPDPRQQRKAEERDWQRKKILDAALAAFAANGYVGASMNEIADVSGFSVGHIYNIIGKKDALFEAVVSREFDLLFDMIDGVFEQHGNGPARNCIDATIDVMLTFFDSHQLFFQVYLNETDGKRISSKRLPSERLDRRLATSERRFKALFRRAIDEGSVADLPPDDLSIAFDELVKGFIGAWAAGGYRGKISKKAKVIKQVLWYGIHR
ncbi:MAG: TetR/AcrR family transcriptional regulator [Candidatus Latescibacterota bacterium]